MLAIEISSASPPPPHRPGVHELRFQQLDVDIVLLGDVRPAFRLCPTSSVRSPDLNPVLSCSALTPLATGGAFAVDTGADEDVPAVLELGEVPEPRSELYLHHHVRGARPIGVPATDIDHEIAGAVGWCDRRSYLLRSKVYLDGLARRRSTEIALWQAELAPWASKQCKVRSMPTRQGHLVLALLGNYVDVCPPPPPPPCWMMLRDT